MVKENRTWECEICEHEYTELNDAIECQSKGKEKITIKRGQIVKYDKDILVLVMRPVYRGHKVYWGCYWFRDNGAGDSIKFEVEIQPQAYIELWKKTSINSKMPALQRLLKFCKRRNITPIIDKKR